MKYRSILALVVIATALVGNTISATASSKFGDYVKLTDRTRVVVAEDKTVEADCRISVNKGPERPCESGSVVWTRVTTYAEVKKTGVTDFVVLGVDTKRNDELVNTLANRVSTRVHRSSNNNYITQGACIDQPNRIINGTYLFSTGRRMYYTLSYATNTSCQVLLVNDRTKTDGSSLVWTTSCTDAESAIDQKCSNHGMFVNGTWTTYYFESNSYVGRKFQHSGKDGLHSAYGWYYFD